MGTISRRYFQKCDVCHTNYEIATEKNTLLRLTLPGVLLRCEGGTGDTRITFDICPECEKILAAKLSEFLCLEEHEYGGNKIGWK